MKLNKIVLGALYDFLGYLTTRPESITFGASNEIDTSTLTDFLAIRNIDIVLADILDWQDKLTRNKPETPLGELTSWFIGYQRRQKQLTLAAKSRIEQLQSIYEEQLQHLVKLHNSFGVDHPDAQIKQLVSDVLDAEDRYVFYKEALENEVKHRASIKVSLAYWWDCLHPVDNQS